MTSIGSDCRRRGRRWPPRRAVALVLEAVDLDPVRVEALEPAQVGERLVELLALLDDDRRLLDRRRRRGVDPVEHEGVADSSIMSRTSSSAADQARGCPRDRTGVTNVASSSLPDVVADLVAAVLDVAQLGRPARDVVIGPEHRLEQPRRRRATLAASSTNRSKKRSSRGMSRSRKAGLLCGRRRRHCSPSAAASPRPGLCDARAVDALVIGFIIVQAVAAGRRHRPGDRPRTGARTASASCSPPATRRRRERSTRTASTSSRPC